MKTVYITPSGQTDASVYEALDKVTSFILKVYKGYGPYSKEDLKQEGMLLGLKAIAENKYDPSRPIENFLYVHVRNRLINFRRDKFRRNDPPCPSCHNSIPGHTEHLDGKHCDPYRKWLKTNSAKQGLLCPRSTHALTREEEEELDRATSIFPQEVSELAHLIDEHLSPELRADYLQLKAGLQLPKAQKEAVVIAVSGILFG